MPQQGTSGEPPEYDETRAPENPPRAVVRPAVRRAALGTYLGGIVLVFALIGAALIFWRTTDRVLTPEEQRVDPSAIGTMGEPRSDTLPGGFDPGPNHGSTRSELEYRGVGVPRRGRCLD